MIKFASIYQQVKERERRGKDVVVTEVEPMPELIRKELEDHSRTKEVLKLLQKKDTLTAKDRLKKLQEQIAQGAKK